MRVLLIGGTGRLSAAVARRTIAVGHELTAMVRSSGAALPAGTGVIQGDVNDEAGVAERLGDREFDVVVESVAYQTDQVERDLRLFGGRCGQYVFISSASAYQKPVRSLPVGEDTPLDNPYWDYSRAKAACERVVLDAHAATGFPVTIVRPSHTYDQRAIPLHFSGRNGSWSVVKRIVEGRPVVIHGDGEALWTFTWNDDFAAGFCGLFGNADSIGRAVNITSDTSITWNEAFRTIADVVGGQLDAVHVASETLVRWRPELEGTLLGDKTNSVIFDNTLIKTLVPGFRCPTTYVEGVARCWEYIQAHPEARVDDPEFDAFLDGVVDRVRGF